MPRKQIVQFDAAASIASTDRLLLQQGVAGTEFTHGTVAQLLSGNLSSGSVTASNGATTARTLAVRAGTMLFPEDFGAAGDGVADDSAELLLWAAACTQYRAIAALGPDKSYLISSSTQITITVPFFGNGSEIVVPNNGQTDPTIIIESEAADIEALLLATVNAWTGLYRGSSHIPELTERDWAYAFTTDEYWLARSTGGGIAKGAAFWTADDDGHIVPPLVDTFPEGAVVSVSGQRRKMRDPIEIRGLKLRYSGSSTESTEGIRVSRPNTRMVGCSVFNSTATAIRQGFNVYRAVGVTFEDCYVGGLMVTTTNYGFAVNYAADITYTSCRQSYCRRGLESQGGQNIRVIGGSYPDGVGGHSVFGLWLDGAYLGIGDTTQNPQCVYVSGADVFARDCVFDLSAAGAQIYAMRVRSDMPEMRGVFGMLGGKVIIDDTAARRASYNAHLVATPAYPAYDAGRTVYMPDRIVVKPDLIEQIGTGSTNLIQLCTVGGTTTAASFTQDIVASGTVEIAPGRVTMEGGTTLPAGTTRIVVNTFKADPQIGDGYKVTIKGLPKMTLATTTLAGAATTTGRYDILVEDVAEQSAFTCYYGCVRELRLRRVHNGSTITINSTAASQLDEAYGFEDIGSENIGWLINTHGAVNQRGSSVSAANDAYSACDRWYVLTSTGSITTSRAADAAGMPYLHMLLQPDVSAKRFGTAQIAEGVVSRALRGQVVSLSPFVYSSAAVTLNYAIIEWTGTENSVTSDLVADWNSTTYTTASFFAASNLIIRRIGQQAISAATSTYLEPISCIVGSTTTNLIAFVWTEATVAQNAWIRLVCDGPAGWPRPISWRQTLTSELFECSRYYRAFQVRTVNGSVWVPFSPQMLGVPTTTATVGTTSNIKASGMQIDHTTSADTVITAVIEL